MTRTPRDPILEPRDVLTRRATRRMAKAVATRVGPLGSFELRRPVFLVGCARSGTTLLERLLAMHPEVADWSEANEIWDPSWFPWRPENIGDPPVEYDPDAYTQRWRQANLGRIGEIRSTFGLFQRLRRRPVFLNKTPYHSFRLPELAEHFPDALFVAIRRDGRAVVNSYMTKLLGQGKLREWPVEQRELFEEEPAEFAAWLARYWAQTVEEMERQDERLGLSASGRMLSTTYEELCAHTADVLGATCEFVGIEADRFVERAVQQNIDNSNHKWADRLSPETQERLVEAAGDALRRHGYV